MRERDEAMRKRTGKRSQEVDEATVSQVSEICRGILTDHNVTILEGGEFV